MSSFRLKMIKEQRRGVLVLIGLISVLEIYLNYDRFSAQEIHLEEVPISLSVERNIEPFDPNIYKLEDWEMLGYTRKQAEVILKYKERLGGRFTSKQQVKDCFVISEEKYKEIEAYILLPKNVEKNELPFGKVDIKPTFEKKNYILSKFNPSIYGLEDWKKIGFSEKQAEIIIKYKNKLGGKFTSKKQIKNCFVISEDKYKEIEPFLVFSTENTEQMGKEIQFEKKESVEINPKREKMILENFDPNIYMLEDWKRIGFSEKQAQVILKYKKSLGGKFLSKKQIQQCYVISEHKFNEISPYILLSEE